MNQPELNFTDSRYLALNEQGRQLERVFTRIESAVLDFMSIHAGEQFYGADLLRYVQKIVGVNNVAPDSPRRVMSRLQSEGKCRYKVVNKAKSLFFSEN